MDLQRYDKNEITGKTIISHKIRVKLELNCMEYCFLELIEKSQVRGDYMTEDFFWRRMGIKKDELYKLLSKLKANGFIEKGKNHMPIVTDKWKFAFEISVEEFETFWFLNKKCCWPGSSKKESFVKYKEVRKLYSAEYLIKKRNEYFMFLAKPENEFRQKMGCPVFLGLDKERFNIEWLQKDNKKSISIVSPVLKEKINHVKLFS